VRHFGRGRRLNLDPLSTRLLHQLSDQSQSKNPLIKIACEMHVLLEKLRPNLDQQIVRFTQLKIVFEQL
jgi:hypothetical protein